MKFKHIPNYLTILRVLMIPVFIVVLMNGYAPTAAIVFAVASLTDALDGYIARKYNLISNFGKLMDPLADKLLVVSAFACFTELGIIPAWVLIVILAREFTITGLRSVAASEGVVIAAGASGKLKTVFQMIAVLALLLKDLPFLRASVAGASFLIPFFYAHAPFVISPDALGVPFLSIGRVFALVVLIVAVFLTVYSGAEYIVKSRRLFN